MSKVFKIYFRFAFVDMIGDDISGEPKVGHFYGVVLSDQNISCGQIPMNYLNGKQLINSFEILMDV